MLVINAWELLLKARLIREACVVNLWSLVEIL